jgi:hypothetical protein
MGMAAMSLGGGGGGPVGPATAVSRTSSGSAGVVAPLPPPIVIPALSGAAVGEDAHASATYSPTGRSPGFPTYAPPPLPPASLTRDEVHASALGVPAASGPYDPYAVAAGNTYSPPPLLPAADVVPGGHSHEAGGEEEEGEGEEEDPFGDAHATAPAEPVRPVTPPAALRPGLPEVTASSYGRRQDDAQAHATMHGGLVDGVAVGQVSPPSAGGAQAKGLPMNREISPVQYGA